MDIVRTREMDGWAKLDPGGPTSTKIAPPRTSSKVLRSRRVHRAAHRTSSDLPTLQSPVSTIGTSLFHAAYASIKFLQSKRIYFARCIFDFYLDGLLLVLPERC